MLSAICYPTHAALSIGVPCFRYINQSRIVLVGLHAGSLPRPVQEQLDGIDDPLALATAVDSRYDGRCPVCTVYQ